MPAMAMSFNSTLVELVRSEQCQRWRMGKPAPVEEFLRQYPALQADSRQVLVLVYNEVLLRQEQGEAPQLAEYAQRFPDLAARLQPVFEVHEAMESGALASAVGLPEWREPPTTTENAATDAGLLPDIPRYEILGELGRGGMGIVYKARDKALKRIVALKTILAGAQAGPEPRARFRSEGEAMARLHHPNIVQIYEVGEHAGLPFLALEYIEGHSLNQRIGAPWLPYRAAQLLEQVARGVHALHCQSIIHRDLKPGNILLSGEWRVTSGEQDSHASSLATRHSPLTTPKITDFGLAKLLDGAAGHTQSNVIVGTYNYMAPEQAQGKNKEIGPATDVYALGAILYELLTGRPPFWAETWREAVRQLEEEAAIPLRRRQPRVPRDLETICLKCLEKEPRQRYDSAAALAEELHRFQEGRPIQARRTPAWERGWKWMRRRPLAAALLLTLGLTIMASGGAVMALADRSRLREALDQAEQARQHADRLAYVHGILLANQELLAHRPIEAEQRLLECSPVYRHWEWHHLMQQCQVRVASLRGHTAVIRGVAYSPCGRWVASAGWDHTVRVWRVDTGLEILTIREAAVLNSVAFSPSGKHLAVAGNDPVVKIWDLTTRRPICSLVGHTGDVLSVAYSPDGQRLVTGSMDQTVRIWDAVTGQVVQTLRGHGAAVYGVAYHPDGQRVASASGDNLVTVWDIATGKEAFDLRGHRGFVHGVAFSPDGKQLASIGDDTTVMLWDLSRRQRVATLRGHAAAVHGVAFSPDGRRLASAGDDNAIKVWDCTGGQELLTITGHARGIFGVAFSPDGQHLVSAGGDQRVQIWKSTMPTRPRTLAHHATGVWSLVWSPDDRSIASGGGDGTVKVWDAATSSERFTARGHSGAVNGIAYRPDGQRIASASNDGTVRVWETTGGLALQTLKGHTGPVLGVAFSRDGRLLASAGWDQTVRLWDTVDDRPIATLTGHQRRVNRVVFSPDGTRLASAAWDGTVKLWDVATRQEVRTLPTRTRAVVDEVVYSPDGRRLASADAAGIIRIWDAMTGQEMLTLRGHTNAVHRLAFSPDGRRLASAGADRVIKLWDLDLGLETLSLHGHAEAVRTLAFRGDGQALISAGADGAIQAWDGNTTH